ncbi:MAG: SH3 domain-containing protein [Pseudomonadota bacterium]
MNIRLLLLAATLAGGTAAATPAMAADPGTLNRAETLREKPFADAKSVAALATGAKVDILTRNGGWYQVKSGTKTGWVRMLSVRRAAATSSASVTGIAGVASGRTGTGKVVTTTGVRGLGDGELTAAAFNETQIAQAEKYRVTRKDADAFAKQGGLVAIDAPALPAPKKK